MDLREANWQRLADVIRAELDRRDWTQSDLAQAIGVTLNTVNTLVNGHPRARMPIIVPSIERVFDWAPGSVRRILEGGDPIPMTLARMEEPSVATASSVRDRRLVSIDPQPIAEELLGDVMRAVSTLSKLKSVRWYGVPLSQLQEVRRIIKDTELMTYRLKDDLYSLDHLLFDLQRRRSRVILVDGQPVEGDEWAVFTDLMQRYGENAAADGVRALRRARGHSDDDVEGANTAS